jgi:signal transduction histidine kinase
LSSQGKNPDYMLKDNLKGHIYPLQIGLLIFLPIYGVDIFLLLSKNIMNEAIAISVLAILNIGLAVAMYFKKNAYRFIPANCILNYVVISQIILLDGFATGSYFYYIPTILVYLLYASDGRHKLHLNTFLITLFLFAAAIILSFIFSKSHEKAVIPNAVFIFRLVCNLLLSAVILRFFLPTFINKENLKVRKNYFEALFQSPHDAYIVFDKETKEIADYNNTASQLFELPYEINLKGLYISQFMMRYLAADSVNLETILNNIPDKWEGEANFRTHKKNEFSGFISTISYLMDSKDYQILCIRDITQIKNSEKELDDYKESLNSSIKVKTRFLSSISHELRTPLNGIIGTTNLVLEEPGISDTIKEQLKLQLFSSEHMLSIINDILDFSKIDSGKMEFNIRPFNLLVAMQNIIKSFESQFKTAKIDLHFKYDEQLADITIKSDEVKLRQILNNLLSNALKFTIQGNVILTVAIENADDENVAVFFSVTDTGIGINKEKHNDIFEGFTQVHAENLERRYGGTGLGLAISQKLTNLFGGIIHVDSDLGRGSRFYFSINFKRQAEVAPIQEVNANEYQPVIDIRGVRILIVEDNEINAAVLKAFLNKWGVRIMEASNGIQALELMKYHKFDLIFMDLEMPEMNGYTATKIIRNNNDEVPVIAFTATLLENMESLIEESGFTDYILKPFKPAVLKSKIERYAPHRKIEYA